MTAAAAVTDPRTPTERLILEVLAARYRLGETHWHFDNRLKPTLLRLQAAGLVWFKSGMVAGMQKVFLTDEGKSEAMWDRHRPPKQAAVVVGVGHTGVPAGHAEVRLWVPTADVQGYVDRLSADPWAEVSGG